MLTHSIDNVKFYAMRNVEMDNSEAERKNLVSEFISYISTVENWCIWQLLNTAVFANTHTNINSDNTPEAWQKRYIFQYNFPFILMDLVVHILSLALKIMDCHRIQTQCVRCVNSLYWHLNQYTHVYIGGQHTSKSHIKLTDTQLTLWREWECERERVAGNNVLWSCKEIIIMFQFHCAIQIYNRIYCYIFELSVWKIWN